MHAATELRPGPAAYLPLALFMETTKEKQQKLGGVGLSPPVHLSHTSRGLSMVLLVQKSPENPTHIHHGRRPSRRNSYPPFPEHRPTSLPQGRPEREARIQERQRGVRKVFSAYEESSPLHFGRTSFVKVNSCRVARSLFTGRRCTLPTGAGGL